VGTQVKRKRDISPSCSLILPLPEREREKKTNEKLHPLVRYRDFDRAISLGENGI